MTATQKVLVAGLAIAVVVVALVGAAFACTATTAQPDAVATINAASTRVQETLSAEGTLPPPPIVTVTGPTPPPAATPASATLPPFQPPTLTAAPPATLTAGPTTPPSRGNGPVITAARVAQPPVIDSNFGDWPGLPHPIDQVTYRPENWTGVADLSARYALAWDANYLYLAVQVTDEAHVQTQRGVTLFRGDSLELLLDRDLAGDFTLAELNGDDYQLGLSPGAFKGDSPEAYLWFPAARAGAAAVTVVVQRTDLGYALEAAIPWSTFGATPAAGQRFGFVLSASDNDTADTADQQTMVSAVSTRRLTDPTAWGTLELAP